MNDLKDIYKKMYGDIKFSSIEQAKEHINKFLIKVEKLKTFT
jgi:hypothetical protein